MRDRTDKAFNAVIVGGLVCLVIAGLLALGAMALGLFFMLEALYK